MAVEASFLKLMVQFLQKKQIELILIKFNFQSHNNLAWSIFKTDSDLQTEHQNSFSTPMCMHGCCRIEYNLLEANRWGIVDKQQQKPLISLFKYINIDD